MGQSPSSFQSTPRALIAVAKITSAVGSRYFVPLLTIYFIFTLSSLFFALVTTSSSSPMSSHLNF